MALMSSLEAISTPIHRNMPKQILKKIFEVFCHTLPLSMQKSYILPTTTRGQFFDVIYYLQCWIILVPASKILLKQLTSKNSEPSTC